MLSEYASYLSLPKIGNFDEAIDTYTKARTAYKCIADSMLIDCDSDNMINQSQISSDTKELLLRDVKCKAAIMLFHIAYIHSKRRNYVAAILAYQRGIDDLRQTLINIITTKDKVKEEKQAVFVFEMLNKMNNALYKLGSIHTRRKDSINALDCYETIIRSSAMYNFEDKSIKKEFLGKTAKAHIKAATIRQELDQREQAISHMCEALKIYTVKHGVSHRDTKAVFNLLRQLQNMNSGVDTSIDTSLNTSMSSAE